MAVDLQGIFSGIGSGSLKIITYTLGAILIIVILGAILFFIWNKKRWNIKVEFKMPRSNFSTLTSEWGKGMFTPSKGYTTIKRAGMMGKKYTIKNFDPRQYLQGGDTLTVVQVSELEFRPVVPISFYNITDDKTGQQAALMEIKGYTGKDRQWYSQQYRSLKDAFSVKDLFSQHFDKFAFGFIILIIFVGFAILWSRIK